MTESQNFSLNKSKQNRKKGKLKIWLIGIGGAVLLILALLFYNKDFLLIYYFNARYNPFKIHDKLYAPDQYVNETSKPGSFNINLYRKVRPLNDDDIDAMQIELWQKALIKKDLNSSNKPYVLECAWTISSDSLCKYKTACIGTYTGSEILNTRIGGKYYTMLLFSITTNKKALIKEEESNYNKAPDGYIFDDGPFYVMAYEVTDKESKTFREIKSK